MYSFIVIKSQASRYSMLMLLFFKLGIPGFFCVDNRKVSWTLYWSFFGGAELFPAGSTFAYSISFQYVEDYPF